MKNQIVAVFIVGMALGIFGCMTRDGVLNSGETGKGVVVVRDRNNLNAKIFLDHSPTQKTTLDGQLPPISLGPHVVHLVLEKYRPVPESIAFVLGAEGKVLEFEMEATPYGSLELSSAPGGANIFINGLEMGVTPLVAGEFIRVPGVPAREYSVDYQYGNFRSQERISVAAGSISKSSKQLTLNQHVMVEDFTNTSCTGCPVVSAKVDSLIRAKMDHRISNNETHAAFPSPSDPIYQAAKSTHNFLYDYYTPPFLPAVYCNGVQVNFGANVGKVASLLDSMMILQMASGAKINLVISAKGNGRGMVTIEAIGSGINAADLRIDLLQKNLNFSVPPGSNLQKDFKNVIRASFNDGKGIPVSLSIGGTQQVPYSFDVSGYDLDELFVVAYIQETATKRILQSNTGNMD